MSCKKIKLYFFVRLCLAQCQLRVTCPQHLDTKETNLRGKDVLELDELERGRVRDGHPGLSDDRVDGAQLRVQQVLQPNLDVSLQTTNINNSKLF